MSKIMIVEDDPMLGEIYQKKFSDAGFDLKIITSGREVQQEAEEWRPDIILLDIVLPDMDGFEILESLKKNASAGDIPVYVFSNLSSKEDMDRATSLGAKGFLTKSRFTPTQLVDETKKIINHQAGETAKQETGTKKDEKNKIVVPRKEPAANREPNGHKVLIIEDEDVFIQMFGDKLKEHGFEVVPAKNGKWGLKEAEKGGFSCILLDMMMPAMNGYEAIQELRTNDNTKNTPIIILSNSALDTEVKKALELGANAYHIKTQITPGEVVREVERLLENK